MFRATAGRPGRRKWVEMVANRCKWRKENEKYPMISKSLGNHGVLAVLATKGTENPSPTTKKRDSLSTVSLVREAGLEGFSRPPTCDPSTNKDRCRFGFWRPPDDQMPKNRCCKLRAPSPSVLSGSTINTVISFVFIS